MALTIPPVHVDTKITFLEVDVTHCRRCGSCCFIPVSHPYDVEDCMELRSRGVRKATLSIDVLSRKVKPVCDECTQQNLVRRMRDRETVGGFCARFQSTLCDKETFMNRFLETLVDSSK